MQNDKRIITLSDKIRFIERVFGRGNLARNEKNFAIWCPMCAPRNRNKKKLVIRLDDDANHCWTCSWKARSLASLIKKYGDASDLNYYRSIFLKDKNVWLGAKNEESEKKQPKLPSDFIFLAEASKRNKDTRDLLNYLKFRNVSDSDLWRYRIGRSDHTKWSRRVLFPSFNEFGNVNYLLGRSIEKNGYRYENDDYDKSIIFNEIDIDWSKKLVLCEGVFDLMKCGDNATCILGCSLNELHPLFDKIVLNNTPIALALDAAAKNNALNLARKFTKYNIRVDIVDMGDKSDPGEMSKTEFAEALRNAEQFDWNLNFRNKLMKAVNVNLS